VVDERRIEFLRGHLDAAARAIASGVPLAGYFVWSLLDNWEWADGYENGSGSYESTMPRSSARSRTAPTGIVRRSPPAVCPTTRERHPGQVTNEIVPPPSPVSRRILPSRTRPRDARVCGGPGARRRQHRRRRADRSHRALRVRPGWGGACRSTGATS
jgi:hypothetical protein